MNCQDETCALTLREAYEQYLEANAFKGFFKPEALDEPLRSFFQSHDLIHIVFGLSTELEHEVLVDFWTFWGVDISLKEYVSYTRYPKIKETLGGISFMAALRSLRVIPKLFVLFIKSRRLKRKWQWHINDEMWNKPLHEVREEFGIELVR